MRKSRLAAVAAVAVLVVVGAWAVLDPVTVQRSHIPFPLLLVASGVLGARSADGWSPAGIGAVLVAVAGVVYASAYPEDLVFVPAGAVAAFLVARTLVRDRTDARRYGQHARDLQESRGRVVLDAVSHERARIARELHDVIAHGINVISLQAGAARLALAADPAVAIGAVDAATDAAGEAIADLRRLTSVLLDDADERNGPQPRLSDVEQLVLRTRELGLDVRLSVVGDARAIPLGIELVAYRLVQESLTNVLKHAGRTRVDVRLVEGPTSLDVEIRNAASGSTLADPTGGHGLVGMRERAALYGGTLSAGYEDDTWCVRAHLPIGDG
ncbi:MAG: sensor histidine kinase [Actinobacteria bacterium]|nr:sensor histidine kinase [Actinomycetota bacterium]